MNDSQPSAHGPQCRCRISSIAEGYGLGAHDDATLHEAFLLIARLLKRGHLGGAARQAAPDPHTEHEVQALIDSRTTLVLDRGLCEHAKHQGKKRKR